MTPPLVLLLLLLLLLLCMNLIPDDATPVLQATSEYRTNPGGKNTAKAPAVSRRCVSPLRGPACAHEGSTPAWAVVVVVAPVVVKGPRVGWVGL
jgi:hypothetical protein